MPTLDAKFEVGRIMETVAHGAVRIISSEWGENHLGSSRESNRHPLPADSKLSLKQYLYGLQKVVKQRRSERAVIDGQLLRVEFDDWVGNGEWFYAWEEELELQNGRAVTDGIR